MRPEENRSAITSRPAIDEAIRCIVSFDGVTDEMVERALQAANGAMVDTRRHWTDGDKAAVRAMLEAVIEASAPRSSTPPVSEAPKSLSEFVHSAPDVREAIGEEAVKGAIERQAQSSSTTSLIPDVDWLANVIRTNSGDHLNPIGAGALAEKIIEAMRGTMKGRTLPSTGSSWIPRSERMPEAGAHVLLTNGEWISTGYFTGKSFAIDIQHESDPGLTPTHWMPLPSASPSASGSREERKDG